jgi:hypothetical protein
MVSSEIAIYEFVCWRDLESCQQQIKQELLKKSVPHVIVEADNANQWFQIKTQGIKFCEIKKIESVNRMLQHDHLRLVRPVQTQAWM